MKSKFFTALIWTLIVIVLSAISGNTASRLMVVDFFGIDKVGHIIFYFIMNWLWMRALVTPQNKIKGILMSLTISITVGYLLELGQKYWFEGRSFEYDDMVANAIGAALAIVIQQLLFTRKRQ